MKIANMVPKAGTVILRRIRGEETMESGLSISSNDDEFVSYGEIVTGADAGKLKFFHVLDGYSFKATDVADALQDYFLIDEEKLLGSYSL